ncbi:SRPBCC family protein [Dactylosporangium sp. NPDC000555]|uniref:SRPBCC family protein n=1 Tax=Dactylosporangium sp. NPDC000555 TaxID=3154260 RepID=UPI0033268877
MAVDVLTQIEIGRPRDVVAAYAADPGNAPQWYANVDSVDWRTAPPVRLGSRVAFVARFLGRRRVHTYEVVEYTAAERLVMRTAEGPFPMETTYTWADHPGGGTLMTMRNRGEPAGLGRLAGPLVALAVRAANRKDLAALRRRLERG